MCAPVAKRSGSITRELAALCRLTLKLMKFIGEHSTPGSHRFRTRSAAAVLNDPAVGARRATKYPFTYWRCASDDGHFISFLEFLKEKNFIHPLSPEQIEELRQNVQFVNCSTAGPPSTWNPTRPVPTATRPSPCSI